MVCVLNHTIDCIINCEVSDIRRHSLQSMHYSIESVRVHFVKDSDITTLPTIINRRSYMSSAIGCRTKREVWLTRNKCKSSCRVHQN
jgi:hypothetical protein